MTMFVVDTNVAIAANGRDLTLMLLVSCAVYKRLVRWSVKESWSSTAKDRLFKNMSEG